MVLKYKLADSTVIEPLINRWPAWSQLISPATASLHLLHHQIPTLESYLEDPELHVRLARDPAYAGGPFSDVMAHKAVEMRELLEKTKEKQRANVEFAALINEFHNRLVDEAAGLPLERYYEQMAEPLRGYVELVYDYYHNPSMRFLEALLYESEYYDSSLQSLQLFKMRTDSRPFFMSTPRLKAADRIDVSLPFESPLVDELFRLDLEPQPLAHIRDVLQLTPADDPLLLSLLSPAPVSLPAKWSERQVRIKNFGHACTLIEWKGISILTDPYVPARPSEGGLERFSYDDLPARIDFALITHNHQDHFAPETLLRLRPRIECLVVPRSYGVLFGDISLKLLAQKIGFKHVLELDTLESIPLPDGEIIGVPFFGEHGDLAYGKIAFLVRAGKEQMLFAADSDCLDRQMYERVCRLLGPIENVFLGTESVGAPLTWHNGPLFCRRPTRELNRLRRYHGCNARTALLLLEAVKARRVYNYAMGKEPWLEHLLGLGTGEDSPQLRESREMIRRARGRGFQVAERPFGKGEIYLGQSNQESPCRHSDQSQDCFTVSQYEASLGGKREPHLLYWLDQLHGTLPTMSLAMDQVSTAGFCSTRRAVSFSAELSEALREFSDRKGFDLAAVLLAALQTVLWCHTGQDEVIIGAPASDLDRGARSAVDVLSPLILRTDLSGEPKFQDLVERVNAVIERALAHRELSFERLAEALETVGGSTQAEKLLQVMFRFIDESSRTSSTSASILELASGKTDQPATLAQCQFGIVLCRRERAVSGYWQYDASSFEERTIAAISDQYLALLESVVRNPQLTIGDLAVTQDSSGIPLPPAEVSEDLEDQFVF